MKSHSSKPTNLNRKDRVLLLTCILAVILLASGAWLGGLHRIPADTTPPVQLSALGPQFVSSVPIDPFGRGGLFLYHRQGANYLLYSIGPDGRDDGGRPITDKSYPPQGRGHHWVQENSKGDMVAGINTDSGDPYQTTKFRRG